MTIMPRKSRFQTVPDEELVEPEIHEPIDLVRWNKRKPRREGYSRMEKIMGMQDR